MRKWSLVGLFMLAIGFESILYAADATFYFGFQKAGNLTVKQVPGIISESLQVGTDWGGVLGGRIGLGGIVGFEQSIGYSPKFLDSNTQAFNAQSNLMINIPLYKFVPYGTVGIGVVTTWGDSLKSFGTKFDLNYGGGLKWKHILGPLGLRFDLRGYTAFDAYSDSAFFQGQHVNYIEGTVNLFLSF